MKFLRFKKGHRGDTVAQLGSGKIVFPRRGGGPIPAPEEVWLADRIEERDRIAVANLVCRLDRVPGTWSAPNEFTGVRYWVLKDPVARRALEEARLEVRPKIVDDLAVNREAYGRWAQKYIESPGLVGSLCPEFWKPEIRLAEGVTVEETVYGQGGAVAVLPRPEGPPRGLVQVKPGDIVVRFNFARAITVAFVVTGFKQAKGGVSFYDKEDDDWYHSSSEWATAIGEFVSVPEEAPGWVRPQGRIVSWEKKEGSDLYYGRCESGAVVATYDSKFRFVHIAGFYGDEYHRHDEECGDQSWAEKVWDVVRAKKAPGPWVTTDKSRLCSSDEVWARFCGDVCVAYIRYSRANSPSWKVSAWGLEDSFNLNCHTIAQAMVAVDLANSWPTSF